MSREQKEQKVEEFVENIESYSVVGLLDMHSLPAKQLQSLKKEMKEFAVTRMSRKTLMNIALEQSDAEGIEEMDLDDATQPAFIFSEKDPFQLYSLIQQNKTSAAAQGGEEAPGDIEVDEGDTGIGPGPMLGKLQQRGLNVQVDDGSIHVQSAGVIIEEGDTITADDAEILSQLGIEPLEIGLDLKVAYSGGEIFTADELDIDVDSYRSDIESAAAAGFNLAVNAGVVNETTAPTLLQEAVRKARNLSISQGVPTEQTIEEIISRAGSHGRGLDSRIDLESVETGEDDEDEPESHDAEDDDEESAEQGSGEDEGSEAGEEDQ
jgi:large subunit ribosomal protein L10